MEDQNLIESRRQFIVSIAGMAVALATEALAGSGCGSSSNAGSSNVSAVAGGDCQAKGTTLTVLPSGGHTHTVPAISGVDVAAAAVKQCITSSDSGHVHALTISAAQFDTLKTNQGIETTTDPDGSGHQHTVIINCS